MKNKVKQSNFLRWYFSDTDDTYLIGKRVIENLFSTGEFKINVRELINDCGYIPQYICEDTEGNADYWPNEIEIIED